MLLGSTVLRRAPAEPDYKPIFGVLWDMIGDADLQIPQEGNSVRAGAGSRRARVGDGRGAGLRAGISSPRAGYDVTDDHMPLLDKGLRVIDVIDLDYGPLDADGAASPNYHHTPEDTLDKVSAKCLQIVGDVALGLLME